MRKTNQVTRREFLAVCILLAPVMTVMGGSTQPIPEPGPDMSSDSENVVLQYDGASTPIAWGAGRIRDALVRIGLRSENRRLIPVDAERATADTRILIQGQPALPGNIGRATSAGPTTTPRAGYLIRTPAQKKGVLIEVTGTDPAQAMYGALDLSEQIGMTGCLKGIRAKDAAPRFPFRAIKFHLPWMSYRKHEALSLHAEACRDLRFWQSFLDMMAENRFNALTLWNLHPFGFMIRPNDFPEACGLSDEELAVWQQFWRSLFRMAKDRGIDTYLVFYNIFVTPEFARIHDVATYSIRWEAYIGKGDDSELVKRYTRACVTQVLDEYEDLAGLGVCSGERMGGMTLRQREDWIRDTVVAGMKAAKRPARLIHRPDVSVERDVSYVRRQIESYGLPDPVRVELKFNFAHGHSSPSLIQVHGGKPPQSFWNPPPVGLRIVWAMRNEGFFNLRWGQPDFIREFIARNGADYVDGLYVGSNCYIPAVDYIQKPDPRIAWRWAFERQWLFYMLWGRLLYDPDTPDALFERAFDSRYGPGTGQILLPAYAAVSEMPLRMTTFLGPTWDQSLYVEGFLAFGKFISVEDMIRRKPMDPAYASIPEYVQALLSNASLGNGRVTPLMLADDLQARGHKALELVASLKRTAGPIDYEIADVKSWARLSLYAAEKLRGAVALESFRQGGREPDRTRSVGHLEEAARQWGELVTITEPLLREVPMLHMPKTGRYSFARLRNAVLEDIAIARNARPARSAGKRD